MSDKLSSPPTDAEINAYIERRDKELGDIVAGIIEQTGLDVSYKTVLSWLRHQPVAEVECGGCVSRREKLNDLSRRFKRWWRAQ
jgi:hypothetical protein